MSNRSTLIFFVLETMFAQHTYNFLGRHFNAPRLFYDYYQTQKAEVTNKNQIQKVFVVLDEKDRETDQFIRDLFQIDNLESSKIKVRQQEINDLLAQMKLSGYFRSVSIKSKISNKQQTITIKCRSMSPLKSITILGNKSIMIPQKLILDLFRKQIDRPQNFRLINEALKGIYSWYYNKGYQWVNITVKQDDETSIGLQIAEGIIDSIRFKVINYDNESVTNNSFYLMREVRNFLDIKEGDKLNYNEIEARLEELKQKKIFASCDYAVMESKNKPTQLDLLISIYELADKTTLLFGQNNNFRPGVVEIIESRIFNSINSLFKESSYQLGQTISGRTRQATRMKKVSSIPIYGYNDQEIMNEILTNQKIFVLGDLHEWYANPVHFINSSNLSIDHSIQNMNQQGEFLKVRFRVPSMYKHFMLAYCKPWLTFYRQQTNLVKIKMLQKSFYSDKKRMTEWFNQIFNHKFIFLDSLSVVKAVKAKLKTQLGKDWRLKQTFELEFVKQKRTSIRKRHEFLFNRTIDSLIQSEINPNIFVYSNPQIVNYTHCNFLSVDTKLKYKFNHEYDIDWSKTGSNFVFLSRYSFPFNGNLERTQTSYYKKFSQRSVLKYTAYKHFNVLEKQKTLGKHFIFLDLEVGNLAGSSTFFPWMEKFEIKFPDYILQDKKALPNFPKLFYKARCEYHLGSPEKHSLFFFHNYIFASERKIFYRNSEVASMVSRNTNSHYKSARIYFGIGYQIKTSIRRLPPIRVECHVCKQSETRVCFKIVEVLSSTAVHKKS
nr:hypothetical protein [Porphyrostromium japonicum]